MDFDELTMPFATGGDMAMGSGLATGCIVGWPYYYEPIVNPSTAYQVVYAPAEPTHCIGKAHVFACDHEPACLCGKVQRANVKAAPVETLRDHGEA